MTFLIQSREQFEYNTDPQRRCYNGCHFSSEKIWSEWKTLYSVRTEPEAIDRVNDWVKINGNLPNRTLEYRYVPELSREHP